MMKRCEQSLPFINVFDQGRASHQCWSMMMNLSSTVFPFSLSKATQEELMNVGFFAQRGFFLSQSYMNSGQQWDLSGRSVLVASIFRDPSHKRNRESDLVRQWLKETQDPLAPDDLDMHSWTCVSLNPTVPALDLPAPFFPSPLPLLCLQPLPCCQSAVPAFVRAVAAAGCRVPGKIILDWLPSLLLLLWHADKMLIGPNAFDTKGETACSRHRAFAIHLASAKLDPSSSFLLAKEELTRDFQAWQNLDRNISILWQAA